MDALCLSMVVKVKRDEYEPPIEEEKKKECQFDLDED